MLVDTHAHLDQEDFSADLGDVVSRACAAGVERTVVIGVTAASSAAAVALAAAHPSLRAAVGVQPNDVVDAAPGDWDQVVELSRLPGVVALGETGLDRYWDRSPWELQQDYFDRHLRLSQQTQLPFVVHMRESEHDVLEMLREARTRGPLRGVMHSFTGSTEGALECIELGLMISFAGMVTFKKSHDLRAVAESLPLDRLLVETDSPYLSPEPVRKVRRNEPAHVVHTARCLAEVRGEPFSEFARQTTANARRLFQLD